MIGSNLLPHDDTVSACGARTLVRRLTLFLLLFLGSFSFASTNSGITYHGRIVKPDGAPLEGANVQFRLQIRTPDASNCLMYEERQTKDMRNSSGIFSITINDGTGDRIDTSGYTLDQIFANRGSFSFDLSACNSGSGIYIPNSSDGRRFQVYFRDETMSDWMPMPAMNINFVPMAIEAKQVGGFTARHLLRVEDAAVAQNTPLTLQELTDLKELIAGTSSLYMRSTTGEGAILPVYSGDPVSPAQGSIWFDSVTGELRYHDGTQVRTVGSGGGGGGGGSVTAVTVSGPPLSVTNSTTTPQISISQAGPSSSGYLSQADWNTFNSKLSSNLGEGKIFVGDSSGQANEVTPTGDVSLESSGKFAVIGIQGYEVESPTVDRQVLIWDQSASKYVSGFLTLSDIRSSTVPAGSVLPATACGAHQTLTWSSPLDTFSCQNIGDLDASAITTGTISTARLPGSVVLNGGNSGPLTIGTNDNTSLSIETNNSTTMTVTASGKVGIGTANPRNKVDVAGVIRLGRENATNEGGQILFDYPGNDSSSDSSLLWAIDVYSHPPAGPTEAGFRIYRADDLGATRDAMFITHDTKVGIGTLEPASTLEVHASGSASGVMVRSSTGRALSIDGDNPSVNFNSYHDGTTKMAVDDDYSGTLHFDPVSGALLYSSGNNPGTGDPVTETHRLVIQNNGYVGIGNTNPRTIVDIGEGSPLRVRLTNSTIEGGEIALDYPANDGTDWDSKWAIDVHAYPVETPANPSLRIYRTDSGGELAAVIITQDGKVGIGDAYPDAPLVVNSGTTVGKYTTSGWTHSSDVRLKYNIAPLENSLEKILKLQAVEYKFKSDPSGQKQLGFIAQDVEKVFPEVVQTDKDGFKSMVYGNLIAPVVEALKELYAEILSIKGDSANLVRDVAALKSENEALKAEISALRQELEAVKQNLYLWHAKND